MRKTEADFSGIFHFLTNEANKMLVYIYMLKNEADSRTLAGMERTAFARQRGEVDVQDLRISRLDGSTGDGLGMAGGGRG
jgi:hypothetical protein